jgi:hypothetical protein
MYLKTITGIHGVPRSGTSWLAQIFNASPDVTLKFQPLFTYSFKDYLSEQSSENDIESFFTGIYESNDKFMNMKDENIHFSYPDFKKNKNPENLVFKHIRYHFLINHILNKNQKVKFILIVRNPLSVLCSWKNAPIEFNKEWNFLEEWMFASKKNQNRKEEYFGYIKWKEATLLFLELQKKNSDRVKVIRYKDLLENTEEVVMDLFEYAGLTISDSVFDFINESKSITIDNKNSVYRLKVSDNNWSELPNQVVKFIQDDLKDSQLECFLE